VSTCLLIVRHGQTDWNSNGRFQGQMDIPLNQTGLKQAQAIAMRLASESPAAIYASDLQRAWQTAEIIHEALTVEHLPLIPEPRLRELCFGKWEGLTYDEILARQPKQLQRWERDLQHTTPPGGETLTGMAERVQTVLNSIIAVHPDATVVLVAHGGPLRMLIAQALGLPPERFWQMQLSNASLSILNVYPEGAILNLLNSTDHLKE
jgi:phosphoserine phosphatase